MDWLGLSLLLAGGVAVGLGRQVLTVGAAKTSADAASALRGKRAALRKWTIPVVLVVAGGLAKTPTLQAGVLMLLVITAAAWTYRMAQILAVPARYKHGVAFSSVFAVVALCGYFAVLLARHVAAA